MATEKFTLGVLIDPKEEEPPSNINTLKNFSDVAKRRKVTVRIGTYDELKDLDYDALFIRETTRIKHHTHTLSKTATTFKIPVIDDPKSIEACCNKLTMASRFLRNEIPTPVSRTLFLGFDPVKQIQQFGYPVVIKDPATCFSRGVFRVRNDEELLKTLVKLKQLCPGGMAQAQEYIPTRFDWRVGVLNNQVLYVCQYQMAKNHWQVIQHFDDGTYNDGGFLTLPPNSWPLDICKLAVKATSCVGSGLYGVDIKDIKGRGPLVIEVNDNPSIDVGEEDKYGNVWEKIIEHFRKLVIQSRVERAKTCLGKVRITKPLKMKYA